jgi:hypothetical protein
MCTDYFILGLLIMIFIYLIVSDVIVIKRRKTTHAITKRNGHKLDGIKESSDKQNRLLESLLKILSERED